MTGLNELDLPRLGYAGTAGLHLPGELGFGKDKFQLTDTQGAVVEVGILLLDLSRQAAENAFDFPRFFNAGRLQVIIGIDDGQGFDVEGRTAG